MIRRPPRSTQSRSSAASDVYKRQVSTQSTGRISPNGEGGLATKTLEVVMCVTLIPARNPSHLRTRDVLDGCHAAVRPPGVGLIVSESTHHPTIERRRRGSTARLIWEGSRP
eukprot:TRINITY_DN3070_c0_g1_i2.p2 TRINITY_DN3070_c0_g1~~TRINITY_DN3070_c0_g1_i2.p2  ORF type:complete len:112 (-),score=31.33 TRINITY_DN3070_c0_g1_i2:257-592(-)